MPPKLINDLLTIRTLQSLAQNSAMQTEVLGDICRALASPAMSTSDRQKFADCATSLLAAVEAQKQVAEQLGKAAEKLKSMEGLLPPESKN